MTKNATPQQPTVDDEDLPQTAVKERDSIRMLRESSQATLAGFVEDDQPEPQDNWEKRYGDLRRHAQKKEQEAAKRMKDLEMQIAQLQSAVNRPMPKTKEELEAWKAQYPEVAAIMETLIDERASVKTKQLEQQLGGLSNELESTKKDRAYAQLKALVPDIEEIVSTPEWNAWFAEFPESIQEQVNQSDDPTEVAKMVKKFKASQAAKVPADMAKPKPSTSVLEASVRNTGSQPSSRNPAFKFTTTQIKNMHPKEFERLEGEIEQARKDGMILDDGGRKVYHTDYR